MGTIVDTSKPRLPKKVMSVRDYMDWFMEDCPRLFKNKLPYRDKTRLQSYRHRSEQDIRSEMQNKNISKINKAAFQMPHTESSIQETSVNEDNQNSTSDNIYASFLDYEETHAKQPLDNGTQSILENNDSSGNTGSSGKTGSSGNTDISDSGNVYDKLSLDVSQ